MKLRFLTKDAVTRLRGEIRPDQTSDQGGARWTSEHELLTEIRESRFVVDPPPTLTTPVDRKALYDAENAKRIHSWLRALPPVTAMDERLWVYLAHYVFPDYMCARWPRLDTTVIKRRYFLEGASFSALARNGIARLWWAGHLTVDMQRESKYERTETLFLRQDIQVSLLERAIGKSAAVRAAVLDFVRDNQARMSSEAFGKRIQLLLRGLNVLGGVAVLDALPASALAAYVDRVGETLLD